MQGLFIKIGQLISNLSNILPKAFREPLAELQDHVDPKPYEEVAASIEKQLGAPATELFTSIKKEALAVASIGQVHRATIGAEEVVVKIQHANIDIIAKADLAILKNIVKLHAFFMDMKGMDQMYNQVRQMIEEELDYTQEANSMQRISESLNDIPELRVRIPKIYPKYSNAKILVSEYYEGSKIANTKELKSWGVDQQDVARRLIELYCKMILVDGFYHADPHPGNILVNKDGEIILLDFGAVAVLNDKMKLAIPELIEAIVKNDSEEIVAALRKMGFIGSEESSREFVEKLITLFTDFLQKEVQFDGMNFQNIKLNSGLSSLTSLIRQVDLREVSNNIIIPKDYILLNRTLVLLLGNSFMLAPQLNTLDVVRPYMKKHILTNDGGFSQVIIRMIKSQLAVAISLPNELSRFLKSANKGELRVEIKGLEKSFQKMHALGQQFLYVFLALLAAYIFMTYKPQDLWRSVNIVAVISFVFLFLRAGFRK